MEDARMEWGGRFQKWNGRRSTTLPYQIHSLLDFMHIISDLQKNIRYRIGRVR